MKQFWSTFLSCLLAIFVSSIASMILSIVMYAVIIGALVGGQSSEKLLNKSVLVIDLEMPIAEEINSDPMSYLDFSSMKLSVPLTILGVRNSLEQAAIDPKIKGIYIKVPLLMNNSLSVMYEVREMLKTFRKTAPEKFVMCYAEAYNQGAIYLSSVCSDVFLNPFGAAPLSGMAVTPMFFKGTLEKLGVEPQIIRHGKFKGAVEPYTLQKLSTENREQYQSLINSQWEYLLNEIAQSRGLDAKKLNSMATNLQIADAQEAKDAGLVDSLIYKDQVEKWMADALGEEKAHTISLTGYKQLTVDKELLNNQLSTSQIAVIVANGEIVDTGNPNSQIVGNNLAKKIQKARKNENVKAIVLRVNSPGGSVIASEVINREVSLAVKEKPLVISMGQYAASGGYWISANANTIVSEPFTVTGSIGVFAMLFDAQKGMKEHLGITMDPVTTNPSADMGSIGRGLSPIERKVFQKNVNDIYDKFTQKVANGRNMTQSAVDSIGQGRIWTGLQAKELGLVDSIGTLQTAIEIAAEQAGIQGNYSVVQPQNNSSLFASLFGGGVNLAVEKISGWFITNKTMQITQRIENENGKIIARMPLDLEFVH